MNQLENKGIFLVIGIMIAVAIAGVVIVSFLNKDYQEALAEKSVALSSQQTEKPNDKLFPEEQKPAGKSDSTIDACVDSDGGKNYFVKGTTVGLAADGVLTTRVDSCWPHNYYGDGYDYVAEWICWTNPNDKKEYATNTNEKCLFGCRDGACINSITGSGKG